MKYVFCNNPNVLIGLIYKSASSSICKMAFKQSPTASTLLEDGLLGPTTPQREFQTLHASVPSTLSPKHNKVLFLLRDPISRFISALNHIPTSEEFCVDTLLDNMLTVRSSPTSLLSAAHINPILFSDALKSSGKPRNLVERLLKLDHILFLFARHTNTNLNSEVIKNMSVCLSAALDLDSTIQQPLPHVSRFSSMSHLGFKDYERVISSAKTHMVNDAEAFQYLKQLIDVFYSPYPALSDNQHLYKACMFLYNALDDGASGLQLFRLEDKDQIREFLEITNEPELPKVNTKAARTDDRPPVALSETQKEKVLEVYKEDARLYSHTSTGSKIVNSLSELETITGKFDVEKTPYHPMWKEQKGFIQEGTTAARRSRRLRNRAGMDT